MMVRLMRAPALGFVLAVAMASAGSGQEAPASVAGAGAKVEDFAWLAGHWLGEGFGGVCEEFWTAPMAGQMHGLFRHLKGGKLVFSEHLTLVEEPAGVVMKVKHFTPEFVAWEEKAGAVRFALEASKPDEARFNGLTLRRTGSRLEIAIRIRHADGVKEEEIRLERVAAPRD